VFLHKSIQKNLDAKMILQGHILSTGADVVPSSRIDLYLVIPKAPEFPGQLPSLLFVLFLWNELVRGRRVVHVKLFFPLITI
jgi:hypothetical protein